MYIIANTLPGRKILRSNYPHLNKQAADSLILIMYLVGLDPKFCVYAFLGLYKTRKICAFSDATNWEINVNNPLRGCLGGFFSHPRFAASIAFALPWDAIYQLLPKASSLSPCLKHPHINYLEFVAAWVLIV